MFPSIYLFNYEVYLYNIFNFLAVMMVIVLGLRWNYRYGERFPVGMGILLCVAPFAFIFGRAFFYLFLACPGSKMNFFNLEHGGSMFLGAFSGGIFGAWIYMEWKKIPKIAGLEVFIPYIPIGGILGRIGCFCQGCCHGITTNSILGLRFPKGSPAWAEHFSQHLISSDDFFSLPVHPTQLYEIGIWILIGCVLIPLRHRNPRTGVISLAFLSLYFTNRFIQDFVRADYGKIFWGLDMMQLLALGVVPLSLFGILLLYHPWKRSSSPVKVTEESMTSS